MASFSITRHAIERYQNRIRPDLTFQEAEQYLLASMKLAIRSPIKTHRGQTCWVIEGAVLVTKFERNENIVVTILRPDHAPWLEPITRAVRKPDLSPDWVSFLQEHLKMK